MTSTRHYPILLHRHEQNPILSAADWPYPAHTVFNAGATRLADGTTLLLCRVEDRRGLSHLCAARSRNGIDNWAIDPAPTLLPDPDRYPEELWGIEDPRITFVEELGKYVVAYDRACMHEFVLTAAKQKKQGASALDIGKALLDEGFHSPTVYFPLIVSEALMIEPTETEPKETLDAFAAAMVRIAERIETDPAAVHEAPTKTPLRRLDEVGAARHPVLRYKA